ncbi:hypothetical protein C2G38_1474897 [Gigaspora rosea]|uniref:Uncharacterized protein n=1 Tax=Gigaspora rosea TaxID=44941 RepID=A0A397V328_9GLOM|nr:hypothetical protein C2G38_1474897 [Gigaspora rosea]
MWKNYLNRCPKYLNWKKYPNWKCPNLSISQEVFCIFCIGHYFCPRNPGSSSAIILYHSTYNRDSHVLPKTKSYSGLSTTKKCSYEFPKYEDGPKSAKGWLTSKILGKEIETSSSRSHPPTITFLPAFVTPTPRASTAGYLDPSILVIFKSIFRTIAIFKILNRKILRNKWY